MNKILVMAVLGCLLYPVSVSAWAIKDLIGFKELTMEDVADKTVEFAQKQVNKVVDQQLQAVGDLGIISYTQSLLSGGENPMTGTIETIQVSLNTLESAGTKTQEALSEKVLYPIGDAAAEKTTAEMKKIAEEQTKLLQDLTTQGIAKANLDKVAATQLATKTAAAQSAINSAATERETTQAYAHATAVMATNLSDVADKAAANLMVVSGSRLKDIEMVADSSEGKADEKADSGLEA